MTIALIHMAIWVGGTVLTYMSLPHPLSREQSWLALLGTGLIFLGSVGNLYFEAVRHSVHNRRPLETILGLIVETITESPERVRCNIMTPRGVLGFRIRYHTGNYSRDELGLYWRKNQGLVGLSISARQIAWASLDHLQSGTTFQQVAASAARCNLSLYGLEQRHWKATSHIRSAVAVPIVKTDRIIGVINLDDEAPPSDSVIFSQQPLVESLLVGLADQLAKQYERL